MVSFRSNEVLGMLASGYTPQTASHRHVQHERVNPERRFAPSAGRLRSCSVLMICPDARRPQPHLRPTTPDEVAQTLSFALQADGRRSVHRAGAVMARI